MIALVKHVRGTLWGILAMLIAVGSWAADGEPLSVEQLRSLRKQAAHRPRRVIFNNDGCDCLYYPRDQKATVEGFLALRTTELAGTQVDTISYCSISSGFSNFTHRTKAGTVLTKSASEFGIQPKMRNIAQELIDQGTDCFQAVVDFARRQKMECFWSMRMNDTHDTEHRPDKPYLLFPPLKYQHPDWLVGEPVKRTPFGRWSSVDYARPEIRDLAFRYIEEVCRNYDVDGVELDFFRHLCYFKSVAQGGVASDAERQMMTDLMRRVRQMTEQIGCRRGRPILVMIRVPDSVEFSRDMGLDVERWLEEGLADLLVTTCYFQLNRWQYSVALGHKYGVPVYAGLSEARVLGQNRFNRDQIECYRGRALNAWAAGADGIYVFNYFNPRGAVFRELGDAPSLQTRKRLYFATVRDGGPDRWLAQGSRYRTIPILTPAHPATITARQSLDVPIAVNEQLSPTSRVQCHLCVPAVVAADQLTVTLNGTVLANGKRAAPWVDYPVPPGLVKPGDNRLTVAVNQQRTSPADEWTLVYDGTRLPASPWRCDRGSPRTEAKVVDGALRIADRGDQPGDHRYCRCSWGLESGEDVLLEARVKVVSGASYVIFGNGKSQERLGLWPDHIDLWHHRAIRYAMNTTDAYHTYRIVTKGADLKVYVDGQLRLDAPKAFQPRADAVTNELAFGASNSPQLGEADWSSVRTRATGQTVEDVVLSVEGDTTR